MAKKFKGEQTPEQIAQWKNTFGRIFRVEVEDSVAFFKRPSRIVLSAASSLGAKDPLKYAETMMENCWLGGDESIKTDDEKFLGVAQKMEILIKVAEASIKEV